MTNNKHFFNKSFSFKKTLQVIVLLSAAAMSHASAHLMVAQHGTLNIKDTGAFMVLSLPVSAFSNIDDDDDGKMSITEFNKYNPLLIEQVKNKITLLNTLGPRPLQGVLLTPVISHSNKDEPMDQLIVMGRFALSSSFPLSKKSTQKPDYNDLTFQVDLFGKLASEKILKITATVKRSDKGKAEKFKVTMTPENNQSLLFGVTSE